MGRLLASALLLVLAGGCGNRLDRAQAPDPVAAIRACSEPAKLGVSRSRADLFSQLRRFERCMANRHVPGRAAFDPAAGKISFAYDVALPTLRF